MKRLPIRLVLATLIAVANIAPDHALSLAVLPDRSAQPLNRQTTQSPNHSVISSHVLAATQGGASASLLVVLRDQADLSRAASLPNTSEKGRFVYDALRQTALRAQAPLRAELDRAGIRYRSFYIVNMLELSGDRDLVLKLGARPDVARIEANPQVLNQSPISDLTPEIRGVQSIEWNIQKVNAPQAWALGYTGQGVVVAGADTGYQWDHPALRPHYRGWNGITATHDYSWHDAIHSGAGAPCPNDSPAPCDPHGHGTHTMGTMVGDDGAGNQIGVVPGAQWIGCRNMDSAGRGTPATYTECFQFFLAPYPVGGDPFTQGDPSKSPAVIGNSWSCPPSEGCGPLTLQAIVDTVRAAGIEVVAAAQNSGPGCSSVRDPIGTYSSVFTVGATDGSDAIAGFSSRGPVTLNGNTYRKPDISAPGVSVRSSISGGGYDWKSGTSMATPHVAGLFALVWSAAPKLRGNLEATEGFITSTAVHLTWSPACPGDTGTSVPNNVFGWGRIDALAAIQAVLQPALQVMVDAPASLVSPSGTITYTLVVANPAWVSANTGVIVTDTLPLSVTFASASDSGVYSPTTRMVTWSVPTLTAQAGVTFTLAVTVSDALTGTLVVNSDYGARSDQITRTATGPPVTTRIGVFRYYLPVMSSASEFAAWLPMIIKSE